MSETIKRAALDLRANKVFVRSVHQALSGINILQDDVTTLNADDLPGIGRALKLAISSFRESVPMPPRESLGINAPRALFQAAGVRRWSEFVKGAKSVSVKVEAD